MSKLIHEAINSSVTQYNDLQKTNAAERATDLEQTLTEINDLVRRRGSILRMDSHDLRSSFGMMRGAAYILDQPGNTDEERAEMVQMLQRNFDRMTTMLAQLMDLARLPVWGDLVKVHRIAQNLLLNALRYAQTGGATLSWKTDDKNRWQLVVEDTGPGLPPSAALESASPLLGLPILPPETPGVDLALWHRRWYSRRWRKQIRLPAVTRWRVCRGRRKAKASVCTL